MSLLRLKKSLMKKIKLCLTAFIFLSYPFIVFVFLQKQFSLRLLSFFLIGMAFFNFAQNKQKNIFFLVCLLSCLLFCINNALFLKIYPVLMNAMIGLGFALSLRTTPLITVFAQKMHYNMTDEVINYTRKATVAWAIFMFFNMLCSLITVFMSDFVWTIYNGLISYLLIGLMFMGEFIVRQRRQNVS